MKRLRYVLLFVMVLLLTSCGDAVSEYEAREKLSTHLKERYGEEFVIGYMGVRGFENEKWFEAEIYPAKYEGTPRENDKYYHRKGSVRIEKNIFGEKLGKAGDTYGIVKINESGKEFFGPKLKELFGENVLQVYDIVFDRRLEDYSFDNIMKVSKEEGINITVKGGIYIFGRVENDDDRERYRREIYKFIQFIKETGTFEYVDLEFYITDNRLLSNKFQTDKNLQSQMRQLGNLVAVEERKNILNQTNESYEKTIIESKKNYLENMIKSNIRNEIYTTFWLYTKVYSEKYIKSNYLDKEIKDYSKLSDVHFSIEDY